MLTVGEKMIIPRYTTALKNFIEEMEHQSSARKTHVTRSSERTILAPRPAMEKSAPQPSRSRLFHHGLDGRLYTSSLQYRDHCSDFYERILRGGQ
jgi:hypothetical protein